MSFNKPQGQSFSDIERAALREYFEKQDKNNQVRKQAEQSTKDIIKRNQSGVKS